MPHKSDGYCFCRIPIFVNLVKIHIPVNFITVIINHPDIGHIFILGRNPTQTRADGGKFCRAQKHIGITPKAVGEIAGGGGKDGCAFAHLGLVAHAQRAPRHFHARACTAKSTIVAFFCEFGSIHFGRRGDP